MKNEHAFFSFTLLATLSTFGFCKYQEHSWAAMIVLNSLGAIYFAFKAAAEYSVEIIVKRLEKK